MKPSTHIRLGLLTLLLAFLAVPAIASAKVQVAAPTRITAGESAAVSADVPGGTESVAFYIDDRRAAVDHSPAWTLPAKTLAGLGSGRHTISIKARQGGRIYGARRVVVVAPSTGSAAPSTVPTSTAPAKSPTVPVVSTEEKSSNPTTPVSLPISTAPTTTEEVTTPEPILPPSPVVPPEEAPVVVPPAPAETAPASTIPTFDGAHISDYPLLQEAPGAITEVPNPTGGSETVFKMTVNDRDVAPITPTENPRAQALAPGTIEAGDEFWLQTKFMVPTSMPSIPGWMSLIGIYGAPFAGAGPWSVGISENELRWQRNGSYSWDIPWHAPLVKGAWTTVLLHERFGTDGWVEMWVNGEKVDFFNGSNWNPLHLSPTEKLQMKTMDASNDGGTNGAKIMQYRQVGMFESGSVYFGALRLGPTRSSVGA